MQVLIVDDDTVNRRLLKAMLEAGGMRVVEASNAVDALNQVSSLDIDLILMDLRMPQMDGIDATRRLRQRNDHKGRVPIAIITADAASDLSERCKEAGADDLIRKPLNMGNLHDAIGRLLVQASAGSAILH